MEDKTVTLNLKVVSDIQDVIRNAGEIQKYFDKIKVPENLKPKFKQIFSDIEKYSKSATDALANGFKTKGDVGNFDRVAKNLVNSVRELYRESEKLGSEAFNLGPAMEDIERLDKDIESLSAKIGAIKADNLKEVQDVINDHPGNAQAWSNFFEAFKKDEPENMAKALKTLEAQVTKATNKFGELNKENANAPDHWVEYAKKVEQLKTVYTEVTDKTSAYSQALEQLHQKQAEKGDLANKAEEESVKTYETVIQLLKEYLDGVNGVTEGEKELAQSQQNFNQQLDQFKSRISYFFGAQNAVNLLKRAIQSAFETVKDLDKVMTETAVVTDFNVGDMWSQLPEYTKRANELGVSIHSAYEAATIYYQQGLKTNEVMAVSNATLKMARIASLDAAEATDRMTNALRGFNMEITETNANRVADVYSKLAAISASNVDEISTAMTKTASLASSANMQFETTAAFLAQIIETTRESEETAGTALKTVIARFSEVKKLYSEGDLLGTDEEGQEIDVNKVSTALRTAGINLNEFLTGAKGLDEVFMELASKWDTLSITQQRYIATMAAGSRQQSRFIALMSNYARTQELVEAATNADGAAQKQYEKTLESLETKLIRLKNAWDEFTMGIANNTLIKQAVDLLTDLLQILNKLTAGFGDTGGGIVKFGIAIGGFLALKPAINALLQAFLQMAGGVESSMGKVVGATNRGKVALERLEEKATKLPKNFNEANQALLGLVGTLTIGSIALSTWAKKLRNNGEEKKAEQVEKLASSFSMLAIILGIVGPLINTLGLGPWGVAIMAVVGTVVALGNALGVFETKLEKAKKELERSSKKAKELTDSYKEVQNAIKDIEEAGTLEDLVKGTDEWKEAVDSVNQSYLKILSTYPELSKYIKMNKDGYYEIVDQEGYERALNRRKREVIASDVQTTQDQYQLSLQEAEVNPDRTTWDKIVDAVEVGIEYIGRISFSYLVDTAIGEKLGLTSDNPDAFKVELNEEYYNKKKVEDATNQYVAEMLYYTRQLGEIPEELSHYYNIFFEDIEEVTKYQNLSGIEAAVKLREEALEFAKQAKNNPNVTAFLDENITGNQLKEILENVDIRKEVKKLLGVEVYKELREQLVDTFAKLSNLVGEEQAKKLALSTYPYIDQIFKSFKGQSKEAKDNLLKTLNSLDSNSQIEFLQALASTNFDSIADLKEFPNLLQELGIDTEGATEAIGDLISELIKLAEANRKINFDSVRELLEEFNSRKSNERDWSEEQYKKWLQLGLTEGWEKISEKTYRYTGSREAMESTLQVSAITEGEGLSYNRYAGETDWTTLQAAQGGDQDAIARITGEAAALEECQDELEAYNKALKEGEGIQEALDKLQFATVIAEWNKKLKELKSTLDGDLKGLENLEKGTDGYNNQLALMTTHLNNVLGLNLDAAFLNEGDNLNLLTEALDGNRASWEQLLVNMDVADAKANLLSGRWGDLESQAADLENIVNALNGLTFNIDGTANMTEVIESLRKAGWTADQVAAYLEHLGYAKVDFNVETHDDGSFSLIGESTWQKLGLSDFSSNFGGGGSGGGGGGGKNETWKNPYDELYNLVEKVNEALRQREKLERAYDRILKDREATADELKQNSLDEIANLHREIDLQRQLLDGRRQQLAMVGSETYKDSEGNYKTYAEMGVTQYASYNEETGLLQIDWSGIDAISDTELGGAVEAYVSRLEELQEQIEDAHETMEDMGDQIREIKERNMKDYLEFEERVYDALVERDQRIIDEYSDLSDTIKDTNDRTLDALRESIDMERQIRDNTKKEEDIAEKEARLAYLRRDTSGANELAIRQLEEEINEARESYTDTLIDQAIDQMGKDNDLAADQRERQIEVMQEQLNYAAANGDYWKEVSTLLQDSFDEEGRLKNNSELVGLLSQSEAFQGMSEFAQEQWMRDLVTEWLKAQEGMSQLVMRRAEQAGELTLGNGTKLYYDTKTGRWKDEAGNEYENVTWDTQNQAFTVRNVGKPQTTTTVTGSTSGTNKPTSGNNGGSGGSGYNGNNTYAETVSNINGLQGTPRTTNNGLQGTPRTTNNGLQGTPRTTNNKPNEIETINGISGTQQAPGATLPNISSVSTISNGYVQFDEEYHILQGKINGRIVNETKERHTFNGRVCTKCGYSKPWGFASGGLANFTGPAWLDGTKSHPELVLNQSDTENFIALKNNLAKIAEQGGALSSGDNYYDIDINVDELSSDYDVDRLAERMKEKIYEDGAYRNVNTISFIK